MKKRFKKFLAGLGILGFVQQAHAYAWIILSIVVLVVSGVVVVKLVQTVKHIWPDTPPPNPTVADVVVQGWTQDEINNITYLSLSIGLNVGMAPFDAPINQADPVTGYSMKLQYCYDTDTWLQMGTNLNNVVSDVQGTTNNYSYVIAMGGYVARCFYVDGVVSQEMLAEDTNSYVMVIERSSNMSSWQSVYTNGYAKRFDIYTYTDTNAPLDKAFYRIRQEMKAPYQ